MKTKSPYVLASVGALAGIAAYALITYMLNKFDMTSVIIFAVIVWIGSFIGWKYLK